MMTRCVLSFVIACFATQVEAQLRVESAERDQIVSVEYDSPEMADAFRKARESLGTFFARMESPGKEMDLFAVKIGVPTRRGNEYIWISNLRRKNGDVTGRIDNTPRWTNRLREGQAISFKESAIVDWLYIDGDRMKGNFTACAMNKMSSAAEAMAMTERFRMTCED